MHYIRILNPSISKSRARAATVTGTDKQMLGSSSSASAHFPSFSPSASSSSLSPPLSFSMSLPLSLSSSYISSSFTHQLQQYSSTLRVGPSHHSATTTLSPTPPSSLSSFAKSSSQIPRSASSILLSKTDPISATKPGLGEVCSADDAPLPGVHGEALQYLPSSPDSPPSPPSFLTASLSLSDLVMPVADPRSPPRARARAARLLSNHGFPRPMAHRYRPHTQQLRMQSTHAGTRAHNNQRTSSSSPRAFNTSAHCHNRNHSSGSSEHGQGRAASGGLRAHMHSHAHNGDSAAKGGKGLPTDGEPRGSATPSLASSTVTWNLSTGSKIIPHPEKAHKGGEDACFTTSQVVGLADGVGGWAEHGVDPGLYSKKLMRSAQEGESTSQ